MEAQYKMKANEMDMAFIEAIKKLFAEKNIVIRISEESDESEYLVRHKANEDHLLKNMAAEPSKSFKGQEFKEYTSKNL